MKHIARQLEFFGTAPYGYAVTKKERVVTVASGPPDFTPVTVERSFDSLDEAIKWAEGFDHAEVVNEAGRRMWHRAPGEIVFDFRQMERQERALAETHRRTSSPEYKRSKFRKRFNSHNAADDGLQEALKTLTELCGVDYGGSGLTRLERAAILLEEVSARILPRRGKQKLQDGTEVDALYFDGQWHRISVIDGREVVSIGSFKHDAATLEVIGK